MVRQLIWVLVLVSGLANAAQIGVGVDRNPVNQDESFTLIFRATGSVDDDPDFLPLETDFEVLSQQKKQQMSWVNGESNHVTQWVLKMMAKRSGKLQIPSIAFGDDKTNPIEIKVTTSVASQPVNSNSALFLQVEVEAGKAYVQSQILYTVRFYHRVPLAQAGLSEPNVENAVVEKLGEARNYNKQLNGVEYAVSELRYAIFPQKSGRLKIPPLELTAQVLMGQTRSRFNSFFNQPATQTRRIYSNELELDVLPVPKALKGQPWLPAEQIVLQQQWSNQSLEVKVGEPITRTITLKAKGAMVSQLPELSLNQDNAGLKIYPDKALKHDEKTATGMVAIFQQKIAYIPSEKGRFELPAVELAWFNRETETMEKVGLPATTLTAVSGVAQPVIDEGMPPITMEKAAQVTAEPSEVTPKPASSGWVWLSIALASGWLLTLFLLFKSRAKQPKVAAEIKHKPLSLNAAVKAVKAACLKNDPVAARKALLKWGEIKYGATRFEQLKTFLNPSLQAELSLLNQSLYSAGCSGWSGEKLMKLVQEASDKRETGEGKGGQLEPLYRG
jgi:hypothetical protein